MKGLYPNLRELHVDLNYPHPDSFRSGSQNRNRWQPLGSFKVADPNHITIQLALQMVAVTPSLRILTVDGLGLVVVDDDLAAKIRCSRCPH